VPDGNTFDIEAAPSEKAYHPVKHPGFILNQSN
jgi:hypothetical protein